MEIKNISLPLHPEEIYTLRAGDVIRLNGKILTGRDAAHKRLCDMIHRGEPLPVELAGAWIYYVGPCPAPKGKVIGSCGPTTSGRMDAYAPLLMEHGLRGMIGKGPRNRAVLDAMQKFGAVYLNASGGAGALLASRVKAQKLLAFDDLGTEAIHELTVEDFPLIVAADAFGGDQYTSGMAQWRIDE